ncbi:16S rRNA (adenine(1518)-N(6)/adenine(1519)-N(6))-dimethyltransferase RsmA [Thermanaerothrix sp. 4228-RoL]|uniref:Ribosomal RNA small subunit methyltransferase A n=1 Tax=Thermanaerothrix solaris TaxID=3058434 RepID=A0ABU3NMP8_9CHLR|nr:16S rRNA (adenine(1518)-N(6)/adenine(1519)-N(6))-dimethyltransferase RsmA [Thermanaerothrix sp. 4228-RoL]MDT8898092.1 16S rRNA (adenine(1518)-N(6)/adenine(1519)-N(6))-dimethyltransferase RsmA [Thermanaerothrix sp. 4228-RoL]
MDPAVTLPPLNVPQLLRQHGLQPKKSLGQNFLYDPNVLQRIVAAAEIPPHATVLEVGAGLGTLTRYLAHAARRVVAVELDGRLIPLLHEVLAGASNVILLQGDILTLDLAPWLANADPLLVVANIPYYITSALIRRLLEGTVRPQRLVLTVQREVAERICAKPGDLSLLALSVQVYGQPRPVGRIPAGAFYPPPKVDSTILRVDLYPQPRLPAEELPTFFSLAQAAFAQRRKTLRNALAAGLGWPPARVEILLQQAEIDPRRRAETLNLEEWERVLQAYHCLEG